MNVLVKAYSISWSHCHIFFYLKATCGQCKAQVLQNGCMAGCNYIHHNDKISAGLTQTLKKKMLLLLEFRCLNSLWSSIRLFCWKIDLLRDMTRLYTHHVGVLQDHTRKYASTISYSRKEDFTSSSPKSPIAFAFSFHGFHTTVGRGRRGNTCQ